MINSKSKYLEPYNCVQKMSPGSFKDVINIMCLKIIYSIIHYKCINRRSVPVV